MGSDCRGVCGGEGEENAVVLGECGDASMYGGEGEENAVVLGSMEMRACMEGKEKRMQLCWGSMEHVLTVIAFRSSLLLIGDWN